MSRRRRRRRRMRLFMYVLLFIYTKVLQRVRVCVPIAPNGSYRFYELVFISRQRYDRIRYIITYRQVRAYILILSR